MCYMTPELGAQRHELMAQIAIAYAATLIVFLGCDAVYLATIGGRLFKETLGDVLAPSVSFAPAILFYLVFPIGLVIFAVTPALGTGRWTTALVFGALLGFFAYGTYDMTNWATIRNWTPTISIVDVIWGTCLSGAAATAALLVVKATVGTH